MFSFLNINDFGIYLNEIRTHYGITQEYIYSNTGISKDTIRRIEGGKVIPKIETLLILSQLYKVDLVQIFTQKSVLKTLVNYYSILDTCLLKNDLEGLKNFQIEFLSVLNKEKEFLMNDFVPNKQIEQFDIYLSVLILYLSNSINDYSSYKFRLISALNMTLLNFNIEKINDYTFDPYEIRILMLYAVLSSEEGMFCLSNKILQQCVKWLDNCFLDNTTRNKYLIKLHFNIAYNYHRLSKYSQSLNHSNIGIRIGHESNLFTELYGLYFRKFTAEFHIGYENYMDSLEKCIFLLDFLGLDKLKETYCKVVSEIYGISLDK